MRRSGIVIGLAAAFLFGVGGVIVKPLLDAGWTPAAAVTARVTIAALVLVLPGLYALRFDLRLLWSARWTVLLYATLAVAGVQVAFYSAIERIPVATTLLIEYLAPVALVALAWVRTRRRPASIVLAGSVVAVSGLVLVVGPAGGALDPVGLLFAGIAMVGVAAYYLMGARTDLPPMALIAAGFVVGAVELWILAPTGLLPFSAAFGDVDFLGASTPWWVPMLAVGVFSTACAYAAGVAAIARLGSRLASFLGLTEVLFAAIVGWLLLGESLSALQILGGVLVLGGIVLIRLEREAEESTVPVGDVGVAASPVTSPVRVPPPPNPPKPSPTRASLD